MIKTIDITNITDEMIEVAAGSAQLRAMAGVTEHDALIRGSILAALIAAPAVEPAQSDAEPVAWKHDCAALLTNGVELWIDACPHCGKPRTPAVEPAQAVEPLDAPHPDYAEYITFEGSTRIVISPDDYEQLYNAATRRAPPAIDEIRHRLILVCEYLETVGLMFVSPRVISSQIRAILEAGNE